MSQFDQTTEKKVEAYCKPEGYLDCAYNEADFKAGRNSTKASMEILARALREIDLGTGYYGAQAMEYKTIAAAAITKVKANGDWPLAETIV